MASQYTSIVDMLMKQYGSSPFTVVNYIATYYNITMLERPNTGISISVHIYVPVALLKYVYWYKKEMLTLKTTLLCTRYIYSIITQTRVIRRYDQELVY